MQANQKKLQSQLGEIAKKEPSPHQDKLRRTLEDNRRTTENRIVNYQRAAANLHYVELELDRLESKIKSLAELAVKLRRS